MCRGVSHVVVAASLERGRREKGRENALVPPPVCLGPSPAVAANAGDVPAEEGRARPKISGRSRVRLGRLSVRVQAIHQVR